MNKLAKKKLCWNCEGTVAVSDENCPYCGVSVVPASLDPIGHFAPPYKPSSISDDSVPQPPYTSNSLQDEQEQSNLDGSANTLESNDNDASISEFKGALIAVVLLLSGSVFFLFGLALALFSSNGTFTLQWDASLWFIYSGLSLPLLVLGWRALMKLDQEK